MEIVFVFIGILIVSVLFVSTIGIIVAVKGINEIDTR